MRLVYFLLSVLSLLVLLPCDGVSGRPPPEAGTGSMRHLAETPLRKLDAPVRAGPFPRTSGDPALLIDNGLYRMYLTSPNLKRMQGGIALSTSTDGQTWNVADTASKEEGPGLVLVGRDGDWDEQLETAYVLKVNDDYYLYYCGYPKVGWPKNPGQIGLAISSDGINFVRASEFPVLAPTPGFFDADGLYSPEVVLREGRFEMIYAGHCYDSSKCPIGIYILGATSKDGRSWTKRKEPVLSPHPALRWTANGVAEPALLKGDELWYMFITGGLGDGEQRVIGVARGPTPFGPWQIRRKPLLTATEGMYDSWGNGVLAPTAVIENGTLRIWYLTSFEGQDIHVIGYAELPWPIDGWDDSVKAPKR